MAEAPPEPPMFVWWECGCLGLILAIWLLSVLFWDWAPQPVLNEPVTHGR